MKKNYLIPFSISLILLLLCSAVALADWNPVDPAKWFQLPDLTSNGIDICMDSKGGQRAIGDDFKCIETGPITDIHLWVSMKDDIDFPIDGVTLSIYSNNPSGPGGFSQPASLLWSKNFLAGSFTKRLYYTEPTGMGEWFWDLRSGIHPSNADHKIWQLNFRINPADAFPQTGSPTTPIIYWLVVEAQIPQDSQYWLGWKTRDFYEGHFMDDAVWRSMPTTSWLKLSYQSWHPYYPYPNNSIDMAFAITTQHTEPNTMDFGDAPEGGIAYPATGVIGSFPTCKTIGAAGWIQHTNFGAYFGPSVDFEGDGNAGLCPGGCFPPYDQDECFADGDAGLIVPQSYTIDALNNVVSCPQCTGSSLGNTCQIAYWGTNIDIDVHNHMPSEAVGYVNLLIDWNQDGQWNGSSNCPTAVTPEHVLVNFQVPNPYDGPLSGLMPFGTGFLIGPNPGYVWARFSITDKPITITDWNGEGSFEDGETEDYLLLVTEYMEFLDFGDANDPPYPTLLANGGARHVIVPGILMGASIDSEADGQPNATATGDDNSGLDDEDGVAFTSSVIPGKLAYVDVDLTNCAAGISLYLDAWVDFDSDGSWAELNDQIFTDLLVTPGAVNSLGFLVPATAKIGTTFARFRLSTTQGLSYTGWASDGEVEDYTVNITEKFIPKHLKWSQPPLEMDPSYTEPTFCGWNEVSWTQDPCGTYIWGAADDFRCIGSMPVTSIHWWGSYYYWSSHAIPQVRPVAWMIKFWANVPPDPFGNPSHPGELLWQVIVPNERVKTEYLGWDSFPERPMETCFEYYLDLNPNEYFKQHKYLEDTNDSIYWLGITAIYSPDIPVPYPWGWKTRPAHWMDDAVHYECYPGPVGEICEYWPLEDWTTGESMDLAFELDTDPNYIKWEQPYTGIRNWPHYNDECSMAEQHGPSFDIIRQVADDWLCQKRMPVMSIVWWGSYWGYNYQPCTSTPTPNPPVKPDYFLMSILTDVPVGDPCNQYPFSHPGQVLWEYKAYNYDEVMVGYDRQPQNEPGPPREAVFRYSVKLPEDKWFKQKKVDQIFWLSIMAVYEVNYPNYGWGWTNHKHFYNDDAVSGYWDYSGSEPVWKWEELLDETYESADMSFILFTDPNKCYNCADYDSSGLINFKDFAQFAREWTWSGLPGGYNKADLDCDGDVDAADLKIFCDQWLKSCLP